MHSIHGVVVIVDDDMATRTSVERLLRASGYPTESFESAEDFLRSGLADRASAVVLDIQLDGMSGLALLRQLQAAGKQVPVVFITASDHEATRREAVSLGCVDYLQKPFEGSALAAALERCRLIRLQQETRRSP